MCLQATKLKANGSSIIVFLDHEFPMYLNVFSLKIDIQKLFVRPPHSPKDCRSFLAIGGAFSVICLFGILKLLNDEQFEVVTDYSSVCIEERKLLVLFRQLF